MIKPPSKPTSAAKGSGPDTDPEKKTGGSAAKRANTSDTKAAYAKASDAKDAKSHETLTPPLRSPRALISLGKIEIGGVILRVQP